MTRTAINRTSIGPCVWHCLSVLLLSRGDSNIRILVTAVAVDVCDWNHFSRPHPREIVSTSGRRAFSLKTTWLAGVRRGSTASSHRAPWRLENAPIHIRSVSAPTSRRARSAPPSCSKIVDIYQSFRTCLAVLRERTPMCVSEWIVPPLVTWACNAINYQRILNASSRSMLGGMVSRTNVNAFIRAWNWFCASTRFYFDLDTASTSSALSIRIYVGSSDARRRPSFATAAQ